MYGMTPRRLPKRKTIQTIEFSTPVEPQNLDFPNPQLTYDALTGLLNRNQLKTKTKIILLNEWSIMPVIIRKSEPIIFHSEIKIEAHIGMPFIRTHRAR